MLTRFAPRLTTSLTLGLIAGVLAVAAAPATADDGRATRLVVTLDPAEADAVVFTWDGPVATPMAIEVRAAWQQWQTTGRKRIVLKLNSPGGSVQEGMRLIAVLEEIKRTHSLTTMVSHGRMCASMCVPIYLQGHNRVASATSAWLFHEVANADPATGEYQAINPALSEMLLRRYYEPAGISAPWLAEMRRQTRGADYWQTGQELMASNSGIVHRTLPSVVARNLPDGNPARPAPSVAAPALPSS